MVVISDITAVAQFAATFHSLLLFCTSFTWHALTHCVSCIKMTFCFTVIYTYTRKVGVIFAFETTSDTGTVLNSQKYDIIRIQAKSCNFLPKGIRSSVFTHILFEILGI